MAATDSLDELEQELSEIARALFTSGSVKVALQMTVGLAVSAIDGCDAAGIFLVRNGAVVTAASSDPIVIELDQLQFANNEGPCLDAVAHGGISYVEDLVHDSRWPHFGPAAAAAGIRSVLAVRMSAQPISALNLYAHLPAAYGATDRAKGVVFATIAGLALDAAGERDDDDDRVANLQVALQTRELIGQAQGILMERERITSEQAFDVLRRASQHLNLKVREVAQNLVDTGETPPTATHP